MQCASILIPHFPVQVELHRRPELRGKPIALTDRSGPDHIIFDASPRASTVTQGISVGKALTLCKDLIFLDADVQEYQRIFERILDNLENISPVVENSNLGQAYINLQGLTSIYENEMRLATALLEAIPSQYFSQVGIADGKFSSFIAASYARYGGAYRAPADIRTFLGSCPVTVLPISEEMVRRLQGFGLKQLKHIAALNLGPIQAQFGVSGRFIWELSHGIDHRQIVPRITEQIIQEEMDFPVPTVNTATLLFALEQLLARAFIHPALQGRHIRVVFVEGSTLHGSIWRKKISFRDAIGKEKKVYEVLKKNLSSSTLPGPLENIRLTLSGLSREFGQQRGLFTDTRHKQQLKETMAQLEVRLGERPPIFTVKEIEPWSRIPERRSALTPYVP